MVTLTGQSHKAELEVHNCRQIGMFLTCLRGGACLERTAEPQMLSGCPTSPSTVHESGMGCSRRTRDGGLPSPRSSVKAKLGSTDADVHLGVSLDPVYYVGIILAADHGILGCQRACGDGSRWSGCGNVNDR